MDFQGSSSAILSKSQEPVVVPEPHDMQLESYIYLPYNARRLETPNSSPGGLPRPRWRGQRFRAARAMQSDPSRGGAARAYAY